MKHLEFNLQDGVILKEDFPIGVYSKHKNTLVISNPIQFIGTDKSVEDKEVINYVLDNEILSRSIKLKVKHSTCLSVGYMTNDTYKIKHI